EKNVIAIAIHSRRLLRVDHCITHFQQMAAGGRVKLADKYSMLARYHQHMARAHGKKIHKRNTGCIFINNTGGIVTGQNGTKNTIRHTAQPGCHYFLVLGLSSINSSSEKRRDFSPSSSGFFLSGNTVGCSSISSMVRLMLVSLPSSSRSRSIMSRSSRLPSSSSWMI